MLVFNGSAAEHGLRIEKCRFHGRSYFGQGLYAESSHGEAKIAVIDTRIEGVDTQWDFKPERSLWSFDNAALSITWPETEERPIEVRDCSIEGGYVGIDLKGGTADMSGCRVKANACVGVRIYGDSVNPRQAQAHVRDCVFEDMGFAGLLGYRLDSTTNNFSHKSLKFKNTGTYEVSELRSKQHRDDLKKQADEKEKKAAAELKRRQEAAARKAAALAKAKENAAAAAEAKKKNGEVRAVVAQAKKTKKAMAHPHLANVVIQPSGKVNPAAGYTWASTKDGDFRVKKKVPPKPTGPKLCKPVSTCNVRCENPNCMGPIRHKMYFFNGNTFPDQWPRGWFCSSSCLNWAEGNGFWGMPHPDIKRGMEIAAMDDGSGDSLYLLDEYDDDVVVPVNGRVQVVSEQYWVNEGICAGEGGGVELSTFMAVTVEYRGQTCPNAYVGWFYKV